MRVCVQPLRCSVFVGTWDVRSLSTIHQMGLIHCRSGCEPSPPGPIPTDVPAADGEPGALAVACGAVAQRPASRGAEREDRPTAERGFVSPRTSAQWWTRIDAAQLG